jgi:high affinity choline transporter 7
MLVFGGIPWNCYFQRVLSCRTPRDARRMSSLAGMLTIVLTVPPLLMGIAAFAYPWPADLAARLRSSPAEAMPLLFAKAVPSSIGLLGLAAIIGAVTSSFSSSILSAGSMLSWNCLKRLVWPSLTVVQMRRVHPIVDPAVRRARDGPRRCRCRAFRRCGFSPSDLVFVLLFPQLLFALFDTKANRTGLDRRLHGVPRPESRRWRTAASGLPAFIPYPDTVPFRTLAAAAGSFCFRSYLARLPAGMRRSNSATLAPDRETWPGRRRDGPTLAWLVHLYTALGLVCAAGMAVLIVKGTPRRFAGPSS